MALWISQGVKVDHTAKATVSNATDQLIACDITWDQKKAHSECTAEAVPQDRTPNLCYEPGIARRILLKNHT